MVRTNTSAAEVPFTGNVSRPGGQGQKPSPPMPFGLSNQVAIPRADTQKANTEIYGPPTNVIYVNGFMPRIGYPTGEEISQLSEEQMDQNIKEWQVLGNLTCSEIYKILPSTLLTQESRAAFENARGANWIFHFEIALKHLLSERNCEWWYATTLVSFIAKATNTEAVWSELTPLGVFSGTSPKASNLNLKAGSDSGHTLGQGKTLTTPTSSGENTRVNMAYSRRQPSQ